ncbi:hypothetical protein SAMN05661012_04501 [Chitinophaga sancti]|uniref:Uncharacterized protein n=1 Tax=Chitinophaga sancti TaxID=1004 RepID=A0A1K1RYV1_9BACT|nr:hypothetical protein SAMN05661012_04501 [Chitinophaga sancti]
MRSTLGILCLVGVFHCSLFAQKVTTKTPSVLPASLPPIGAIAAKKPIHSINLGDSKEFPEVNLNITITPGPFKPTWDQ